MSRTMTVAPEAAAAFRDVFAALLLLQLGFTAPHARRFFCSARFGGYVDASPHNDRFYAPIPVLVAILVWALSTVCLLLDRSTLVAAILGFIACRYVLVDPRWSSLARGFGAVGGMVQWFALAVVLLEIARL